MITPVSPYNTKTAVFNHFQHNPIKGEVKKRSTISGFYSHRYHKSEPTSTVAKTAIALASVIGTIIPLAMFAKKQDTSILKVDFKKLDAIVGVSTGAVVGGVIGGMAFDKKERKRAKVNEGIFQFMNAVFPPLIAFPLLKQCEKTKSLNNIPAKAAVTLAGLGAGMYAAIKLSNLVIDPYDKVPDRKLKVKDAIANIDEGLGVLAMANLPGMQYLHLDKVLPAIYAWGGYRAGISN